MDDLQGLAAALRARKVSSRELVAQSLREIERLDAKLNAFITVTGDAALAEAAARDEELARGVDRGPLHGIPIAHKDLMRTKGVRTTAGSKIFADYFPRRDAAIVTKLREAGAVSVGKTGLHELAYGITSNNPHFGAIHNPWDLTRIPGRFERRVSCGCGSGDAAVCHRERYGRIDSCACIVLRRGGFEADLRASQRQRSAAARLFAGSCGAAHAYGPRRGDCVSSDG